jgi:hypothetical protein
MLFLIASNEPTAILMLSEKDVRTMRTGRTVFADSKQLHGPMVSKIVLSLHPTDQHAIDVMRKAGHKVPEYPPGMSPQTLPVEGQQLIEGQCGGCAGIMPAWNIHDGMCIVCWCDKAKRLEAERN